MSRICAFFDVNRTLVACNTGRLFLRDLRRRGRSPSSGPPGPGLDGEVPPLPDRPSVGRDPDRRADARKIRERVRRTLPALGRGGGAPPRRAGRVPANRTAPLRGTRAGRAVVVADLRDAPPRQNAGHRRGPANDLRGAQRPLHGPPRRAGLHQGRAKSTGPRTWARGSSSISARAGSIPTRTPTCRCWSGSATAWW